MGFHKGTSNGTPDNTQSSEKSVGILWEIWPAERIVLLKFYEY